jgi:RNA polymerase subunit RPABC4/transcription elongation factor Spt4
MTCACCGGAVPQDAKCCPYCGAVEYRGLFVLSPGRPALWVGGISGFVLGALGIDGDVLTRFFAGSFTASIGALVCGLLASISFPGRTLITCKKCGGSVAPDAERCPHCETRRYGRDRTNRILLAIGSIFGGAGGFIYGISTASHGFLAHAQNGIVFAIAGTYAGAVWGFFWGS